MSTPIDFYREVQNILADTMDLDVLQEKELRYKFMDLCQSVATRVEESIIERCARDLDDRVQKHYGKSMGSIEGDGIRKLPRLYASQPSDVKQEK